MADGDSYTTQVPDRSGHYSKGAKLIDDVPFGKATAGAYKGPWTDISTLKNGTVEVRGTFTADIAIEGTNKDGPLDTDGGFPLCPTMSAAGLSPLSPMPVRFVRANVSNFTAGSLSVDVHGVA